MCVVRTRLVVVIYTFFMLPRSEKEKKKKAEQVDDSISFMKQTPTQFSVGIFACEQAVELKLFRFRFRQISPKKIKLIMPESRS